MNPAKARSEDIFERKMGEFVQKVNTVQQNAQVLQHNAIEKSSKLQNQTMLAALEELKVALEELHVASEEMKQQNEELKIARTIAEIERQRYHELFELAPDGYIVTDDAGIIREANRAAANLLNLSPKFL
ncbi:MAG TPA: PAS domain-containing protein, partial [Leptolyngbyaceae cyanobacterium]